MKPDTTAAHLISQLNGGVIDLSVAHVSATERWRHAAEAPRHEEAIERLLTMLWILARRRDRARWPELVGRRMGKAGF